MKKPMTQQPEPQAPAVPKSTKGLRTVTVASKIPMHINLQLCRKTEAISTGRWGNSVETIYVPHGKVVTIRGTGYPSGTAPKGFPKPPDMVEDAGFALTPGVDADFFEQWMEQNKDTLMVMNGLIAAAPTRDDIESLVMDFKTVQSGLDPLLPDDDPRAPQPMNPQIEAVKPDVDRRSRQRAA